MIPKLVIGCGQSLYICPCCPQFLHELAAVFDDARCGLLSSNPGGGIIHIFFVLLTPYIRFSYIVIREMGLVPSHWGPHVWAAIHLICLGAPDTLDSSQQQSYRSFFEGLPYVLPCATCATHLLQNLEKVPISGHLGSKDELFEWSVKLHNVVNEMLGKPPLSLEDAKRRWMSMAAESKEAPKTASEEKPKKNGMMTAVAYTVLGIIIGALFAWILRTNVSSKGRRRN